MSQKKLRKLKKQQEVLVKVEEEKIVENFSFRKILKENWKFLVLVIIGAVIIYWNGMNGAFVSDDYATIPNNPDITSISRTIATMPNLVNLSNTFIAKIFGIDSPLPYHVYNLIIFLTTLVFEFVFIYIIMGKNLARLTTIIFAVHPIHVEAVTWIAGRPYSMFSPFAFVMLSGLILLLQKKSKKYLVLCVVMLLLVYKSDAVRTLGLIIFVVPLVLIYAGLFKKVKVNWGKLLIFAGLIVSIIVITLWRPILDRINIVNSGYNTSESVFYSPFFQYPTSITKYLQLLTVPIDLTLYHTMYTFPVWLNWWIFLLYIANVVYFLFKDKRIFFALIFIFAGTAASMAPVKVAWLVAERYIFFGSTGFCLFLAILFLELWKKARIVTMVMFGLMVGLFSIRLMLRNNDWNTNHNLWVNTCQVSPNSHNAWNNIGDDYDKLNDPTNAIKGFTQSTIVKPNYADAYHNRANIFFKIGRLDLARESYSIALNFSPGLYQTYLSLTQIDLMEGKGDLAVQHSQAALKLQPNNPQAAYVAGVVYAQIGQLDEAKQIFTAILQKYPTYKMAQDALTALEKGKT